MSLIGDALRKTRQEAAQKESDRKGLLFSAKIGNPPTRSNLGLGLALGALIAVAATVAGGGAVWWLLGRGEATPSEATGNAPTTAEQIAETKEETGEPVQPSSNGSDSETRTNRAARLSPASAAEAGPNDLSSQPSAARLTGAVEKQTGATPQASGFKGGFTGVEDGADVYILEAKLGKVELSLDYIIFRPDDPFTEINGVELHLGGVIDGYRVKAIEHDRVHLSNGRKEIVLRTP